MMAMVNLYIISSSCDPMNYYTNVSTALKWIAVTVATILKLRDFRGIIEHFPLRGHIQGRRIQKCLKG